jgi:hypothetical protein
MTDLCQERRQLSLVRCCIASCAKTREGRGRSDERVVRVEAVARACGMVAVQEDLVEQAA